MDSTYVPEEHNGTGATKTIFTDTVEENFLRWLKVLLSKKLTTPFENKYFNIVFTFSKLS